MLKGAYNVIESNLLNSGGQIKTSDIWLCNFLVKTPSVGAFTTTLICFIVVLLSQLSFF